MTAQAPQPLASNPGYQLASVLKAIEDCKTEEVERRLDFKKRMERLRIEAAQLQHEILTGQKRLPLEPTEETPLTLLREDEELRDRLDTGDGPPILDEDFRKHATKLIEPIAKTDGISSMTISTNIPGVEPVIITKDDAKRILAREKEKKATGKDAAAGEN